MKIASKSGAAIAAAAATLFLAGATVSTVTSEMVIEPVLLSLCCTQLNRGRKPGGKIDQALLKGAGESILEKFYTDALADAEVKGPPDVALFVEDKLIQGGFRFPWDDRLHCTGFCRLGTSHRRTSSGPGRVNHATPSSLLGCRCHGHFGRDCRSREYRRDTVD